LIDSTKEKETIMFFYLVIKTKKNEFVSSSVLLSKKDALLSSFHIMKSPQVDTVYIEKSFFDMNDRDIDTCVSSLNEAD